VTLSCAAPAPVTVRLTGFPGLTIPARLTVPRGKAATSAAIRTATRKKAERGRIGATLGTVRKTAALAVDVTPRTCETPALASVTLPSLGYVGGQLAVVVKLNCAAAAPVRVSLASSDRYLPVPGTVTIGQYYAAAAVPLSAKAYHPGQFKATVRARFGGKSLARAITVDPGISELAIDPESSGPDNFTVEVLTTGVVPAGGIRVGLRSSSRAVTMPASYRIPAGSVGSQVAGVTIHAVARNTRVRLSATLGGMTRSASYVLIPPWNDRDKLTIIPDQGTGPLYGGEQDIDYYITLSNPAPASGLTVNVTVADPDPLRWQLAPPVRILPGWNNGAVAVNVPDVATPAHTTMTATVDGVSASVPVTVEPGLASFSLPATIVGGESGTGTISLGGPVDTPTTVYLQSTGDSLAVPASVTIPAGSYSATFPLTTATVTAESPVSVDAFLGTTMLPSGEVEVLP